MGRRERCRQKSVQQHNDENIHPGNCSVAIVGAGLTGLATALLLAQATEDNHDKSSVRRSIKVFEQDESFTSRQDAYGLTLTYNPNGILQELGILDEIADSDCPSRSHYLFRMSSDSISSDDNSSIYKGEVVGYFGNDFFHDSDQRCHSGWGQRGNLRVPRQTVRKILLERLRTFAPYIEILWNHKLTNVDAKEKGYSLQFQNGVKAEADLLIAADGINSSVVSCILPEIPKPQSLGVRIILGITDFSDNANERDAKADAINQHFCGEFNSLNVSREQRRDKLRPNGRFRDLLHERGFYTISERKRMFVMPFSIPTENSPARYMWQLSFADDLDLKTESIHYMVSHDNHVGRKGFTSDVLRQHALFLTKGWHDPIQEMIQSTSSRNIWGTLLRDREPTLINQGILKLQGDKRIIVAGDALHAMSPFKGQGANNCLRDARTIAKWFGDRQEKKSSFSASVKGCMRELVQRSAPIVVASRHAAQFWHSTAAMQEDHKFAGIDHAEDIALLVKELRHRCIHPETPNLTATIKEVILDLYSQKATMPNKGFNSVINRQRRLPTDGENDSELLQQAYQAARKGNLGALRRISWLRPQLLRLHSHNFITNEARIVDKTFISSMPLSRVQVLQSTCLHAAAEGGYLDVVRWLITEAGCAVSALDCNGLTPAEVSRSLTCKALIDTFAANSPVDSP